MRKLKLQMQLTLDGFSGGPNGELDWMTWSWDDVLKNFASELHKPVDTILLGRKMMPGFIGWWTEVAKQAENPEQEFGKLMVDTPKVVFTKTLDASDPVVKGWPNTRLAKGDITEEVNSLKKQDGGDIIVYGGADFVSSLVKENLIDDYYFYVNPVAIGKGLSIFDKINGQFNLKLANSQAFECGIVVLHYQPVRS